MRLWGSKYKVVSMSNVVLYFPGNAPPLIANESVANHLPEDMIDSLGRPLLVRSGAEIVDVIQQS
jgi:hypothetical protein